MIGPFSLERPDGTTVTVPHAKNKALLVLLLASPRRMRARRWLEATLWSDRGQREASQSLRTALSTLRRELGAYKDALQSNRSAVHLVEGSITSDLDDVDLSDADPDFVEGIDIRDEAFEAWLTAFRREQDARRSPRTAPVKRDDARQPLVVGRMDVGSSRMEEYVAEAMLDFVDRNLTESLGEGLHRAAVPVRIDRGTMILRAAVVEQGEMARLALRLEEPVSRRRLWDGRAALAKGETDILRQSDLLRLVHSATSAVIHTLPRLDEPGSRTHSHALLSRAVREMFTFDPAKLRLAEGLITSAEGQEPRAIHLAWRALLYQFMLAERSEEDLDKLKCRSSECAQAALAAEPDNSIIQAICSVVHQLLDGTTRHGRHLAQRAIESNPSNVIAHTGLAVALARDGRPDEAKRVAERAHAIASGSPALHWIEMFHCLAAISCGQYQEATMYAESALSRAPQFRPPMRHLYALHLQAENFGLARNVAAKLRRLEPGFSLRQIRDDPQYPASTLRTSRLIELDDVPPYEGSR
ncbi:MAG: tetratricopeptide repeat protein [Pseudomonadota bacterium]